MLLLFYFNLIFKFEIYSQNKITNRNSNNNKLKFIIINLRVLIYETTNITIKSMHTFNHQT